MDINRIAGNVAAATRIAATEKQKKYREYFEKKLKKYKVDSPDELGDKKKQFFNEVDKDREADNEED